MEELSDDAKIELIESNLQETIGGHVIRDVIKQQKRPLVIYWGTATTGRPSIAYFVPLVKIADFLKAGCVVKILLADVHGFLDNLKAPIQLVEYRAKYYRYVITALLRSAGVPVERLEFVLGSSYQKSPEYVMDLYRMMTVVTERDAKKAGAEVVKQVESPFVSGLIYPLMQALDEEYLKVDCQFGGVDQRRIFALATEQMPKLNFKPRAHLMNSMLPSLTGPGSKMSSSDPESKIDVLDNAEAVRKKIKKAYAVAKEVEGNGMISFVEYVLLPVSKLKLGGNGQFVVERRNGEGEPLVYEHIESLKEDYKADKLTPQLLKSAVTNHIIELLKPIQAEFQDSIDWQDIEKAAYPPPEAKKSKKARDKGSKHPGVTKGVEVKPDGHVEGERKDVVSLGTGAETRLENLDINVNEQ